MRNRYYKTEIPNARRNPEHAVFPKDEAYICRCGAKFKTLGALTGHLFIAGKRYWEPMYLHAYLGYTKHGGRVRYHPPF